MPRRRQRRRRRVRVTTAGREALDAAAAAAALLAEMAGAAEDALVPTFSDLELYGLVAAPWGRTA